MKCYTRITLFLMILSTSGVMVTRWAGTGGIMPYHLLYTYADGSPCPHVCLLGVEPGYTSLAEAEGILIHHPLLRGAAFTRGAEISVFATENLTVMIFLRLDQQIVAIQIAWWNARIKTPPLVGNLQNWMGTPRWVEVEQTLCRGQTTFHFAETLTFVALSEGRVRPDDPVVLINLTLNTPDLRHAKLTWQGYTSIEHYGGRSCLNSRHGYSLELPY